MIIRAFAIALLLLLGAGGFHYLLDAEQQEARRQASRHLASVASLKVDQLTGWRGERLSDAIVLMHNPGFADDRAIARLMQGDAQARAAIREFFRSLVDQYGYEDVMLVNAQGDILPGLGNRLQALPTGTRPLLEQAWRSRQAVLSDPLEDQAGAPPRMSLIAPLLADGQPQGAVILVIDARRALFPLLEAWPVYSRSAEILLVRQLGDELLYLSPLRHRPGGGSAPLRISLSRTDTLAVRAASGQRGIHEGPDYRGAQVIAAALPVPGSSWLLIAKMDSGELHRDAWQRLLQKTGWLLATLASLGALAALVWQRQQARARDRMERLQASERRSLAQFLNLFQQSQDGIFLLTDDHRFHDVNPAALRLLGYRREELLDLRLPDILAQTEHRRLESAVASVMAGIPAHDEWLHARKDGSTFVGDVTAMQLDDTHYFATLRDITQIREARLRLAESEERLRLALDAAQMGTFDWNLRARKLNWSPHHEWLWGFAPGEFPGTYEAFASRVHPDDLAGIEALVRHCITGHARFEHEFRVIWPDQSQHWILALGEFCLDDEGQPIQMRGTVQEITLRKTLEKSLALNQHLVEHATDGIFLMRDNGGILAVNRAACQSLEYSREQLQRLSVWDIDPDLDQAAWQQRWQQMEHGPLPAFESRHCSRTGATFPVEISATRFAFGGESYVCAFVRNISERRQTERTLRELNDRLEQHVAERTAELLDKTAELSEASRYARSLIEASIDPLVTIGADGRIMDVNHATEKVTGRPRAELIGSDFPALFTDPERARLGYRRIFAEGEVHDYPLDIHHVSGTVTHVLYNACVYRNAQGEVAGVFAAARDLTDLKRAEAAVRELNRTLERKVEERTAQLAAASAAKSQFLAHMSHEIRTPMNAILGMAQVLGRNALSPELREMVDHITEAGDTLLRIINDILDLSKIEAGQLSMEFQAFRLDALLEQVDRMLRGAATAKNIALVIHPPAETLGGLVGDNLRLEQVLINLGSNAIKFTARGGVDIAVETLATNARRVRLRFVVRDTGMGIAPTALERLFQPFSQADSGITRRFGGTGLGLAISQRLVGLMGGQIRVESEPGRGSRFWFELDFERTIAAIPPHRIAAPGETPPSGPRLGGLRVLAVDDNRINLRVLQQALQLEGAEVALATDGREALRILEADPARFEMVLMDVQMPVMDGLTATRRIRENPALAHLPVIALSAGVLAEERSAAQAAGMTDFLPKPMNLEQMASLLAELRRAEA